MLSIFQQHGTITQDMLLKVLSLYSYFSLRISIHCHSSSIVACSKQYLSISTEHSEFTSRNTLNGLQWNVLVGSLLCSYCALSKFSCCLKCRWRIKNVQCPVNWVRINSPEIVGNFLILRLSQVVASLTKI